MCPYSLCMGFALFSVQIAGNAVLRKTLIVLGAFTKLRKVTVSFVMCVSPSASKKKLGSHRKNFYEISYLIIFLKFV